eukprot:6754504-Ditylum_brightwellii.AAC.1
MPPALLGMAMRRRGTSASKGAYLRRDVAGVDCIPPTIPVCTVGFLCGGRDGAFRGDVMTDD